MSRTTPSKGFSNLISFASSVANTIQIYLKVIKVTKHFLYLMYNNFIQSFNMSENTKDTYVLYGHAGDGFCVQLNNNFYYLDNNITANRATYGITIKEGEEVKEAFVLTIDRATGHWVFTNGYSGVENVTVNNNPSKLIVDGKDSDDTITFELPTNYLLTIQKTS